MLLQGLQAHTVRVRSRGRSLSIFINISGMMIVISHIPEPRESVPIYFLRIELAVEHIAVCPARPNRSRHRRGMEPGSTVFTGAGERMLPSSIIREPKKSVSSTSSFVKFPRMEISLGSVLDLVINKKSCVFSIPLIASLKAMFVVTPNAEALKLLKRFIFINHRVFLELDFTN